ncbi:uncharacterized protein N7529_003206 [Penicillium soppii]|uniref:uncharacterized protein n=1 Tax=Penicillium soppii TaxID=69789 RepID=UPI002548075A|nr:uncharacterized protein N7529_003206 [Penicillium soppii]KAJ5874776.1 hypothetical protein N7529_003206 [Penicillium soppii]
MSTLLIPPAFFGLSALVFLVAIQLPLKYRVWLSPLLFGSAYASLSASQYLDALPSVNTLWGLFTCIWILHAISILFIDKINIPRGAPPWNAAYKIWMNPRRQFDREAIISRNQNTDSTSRAPFIIKRLFKAVTCCVLQFFIIGPFVFLNFSFTSHDFGRVQEIFIRRLIWSDYGPSITPREIQIRILLSVYWIWLTYFMLEVCHILLSVFFVVIIRVDTPEEWPPLFGSVGEAYGVRRFWAKFWHQLTTPCCASSGKLITRRLLRFKPASFFEKCFIAFWTFFLSAIYHFVADWMAGEPCRPMNDLFFFLINFLVVTAEIFVASVWTQVPNVEVGRGKHFHTSKGQKLAGLIWLLLFFFWSVPKWQYSKLQAMVERLENSRHLDL